MSSGKIRHWNVIGFQLSNSANLIEPGLICMHVTYSIESFCHQTNQLRTAKLLLDFVSKLRHNTIISTMKAENFQGYSKLRHIFRK